MLHKSCHAGSLDKRLLNKHIKQVLKTQFSGKALDNSVSCLLIVVKTAPSNGQRQKYTRTFHRISTLKPIGEVPEF